MKNKEKTLYGILSAVVLALIGLIFWEIPNTGDSLMQTICSKIFALIIFLIAFIIIFFTGYYKAKRELE